MSGSSLLAVLAPLYKAFQDSDLTALEFSKVVLEELGVNDPPDPEILKLERTLTSRKLHAATKGFFLVQENERVLRSIKIISDIRPVFEHSGSKTGISGLTVFHSLKCGCTEGNVTRDIYFAMDRKDLALLQVAISRAIAKHDAICEMSNKAELPIIETDA